MVLPECNDHVAVKKFLKQLHFEVNILTGSQVETSKTVSENAAILVNLAKDLKGSYAEFESAKAAKRSAIKNYERTAKRKHAFAENHDAQVAKVSADTNFEAQLAKMYGLVIDYIDCRSKLQFAIDGEINYQIPETIPAINIEELFAPEAPAKVA